MPTTGAEFARGVLDAYRRDTASEVALAKSVRAASVPGDLARPMGHPAFADLPLGGTGHCQAAVAYLDLVAFTARSFWDPPESMVRLAGAVLTQLVEVVRDMGGHPLGLRGDGVFACFGGPDSTEPAVDVAATLGACAFALDATESALNNLLAASGLAPVQLRGGADYGRLDFVRTGTDGASEVNVIGFAANFASKCEKQARSWELVAGEGLTAHVTNPRLISEHRNSPKTYQRDYQQRSYRFYDVHWRSVTPHTAGIAETLAGSPISRVRIR
jgi:adenylate cyclase